MATATTHTYAIDAVNNADSFHHYAVSNAVRNAAVAPIATAPVIPRITGQNSGGPQTAGGLAAEGSGGIAALTNDTFTANTGGFAEFLTPASVPASPWSLTSPPTLAATTSAAFAATAVGRTAVATRTIQPRYSLVGDSNFHFFGTIDYNLPNAGAPSAITSVFETSVTGVDTIRVDFLAPQEKRPRRLRRTRCNRHRYHFRNGQLPAPSQRGRLPPSPSPRLTSRARKFFADHVASQQVRRGVNIHWFS